MIISNPPTLSGHLSFTSNIVISAFPTSCLPYNRISLDSTNLNWNSPTLKQKKMNKCISIEGNSFETVCSQPITINYENMNEWINEMDTYIPPNIRLINPISRRFTNNRRFTSSELPIWVEESLNLMLTSTVSFLIVTYSDIFLSFNHLSNCFFSCPPLFLAPSWRSG